MQIKLAPNRVALTQIDFEPTGSILVPPSKTKDIELGKVIETGPSDIPFVDKGDFVVFQLPHQVKASTMYKVRNEKIDLVNDMMVIMHEADIIARLKSADLSIENFEIAGDWILLDMFTTKADSPIITPDTVTPPIEEFHFKILQVGRGVKTDFYTIGTVVYVEKNRCNPIMIGDKEYIFINKNYVYGVKVDDPILVSSSIIVD